MEVGWRRLERDGVSVDVASKVSMEVGERVCGVGEAIWGYESRESS